MFEIFNAPHTQTVTSERWLARSLSIPWAYWATFWTWFVLAPAFGETDFLPREAFPFVTILLALMCIGGAVIASVWGKEDFGGSLLMADGVLILAGIVIAGFLSGEPLAFLLLPGIPGFITMVLPPLWAGYLFRECHKDQTRLQSNRRGT